MNIQTIYLSLTSSHITAEFVAKFVLFFAILLLTTVIIGKILKYLFKMPIVAGQILGGAILGPSLLNIEKINFFNEPIKLLDSTKNYVCNLASTDLFMFFIILISSGLTISYLLWLAGHETDVKDMATVGLESTLAGVLAAILPVFLISFATYFILGKYYSLAASVGQGLIFAATSVSIPIATLISYGKMNLRSSKATVAASIIDDILAIILFSIFIIFLQSGLLGKCHCSGNLEHCLSFKDSFLKMILAFVLFFLLGKFVIIPVSKWLSNKKFSHLIPPFAVIMMLTYFSLAELIGGLAGITGAYFAGLFHRSGDNNHKAVRAISPFVNTILLPIFLGSIGMQINVTILKLHHWGTVLLILFLALISKLLGCYASTSIANLFMKK